MKRIVLLLLVFVLFPLTGCVVDDDTLLPILFVHGPSGSAAQFESQAQRFLANGYTIDDLDTMEYDSTIIIDAMDDIASLPEVADDPEFQARLDAKIENLMAVNGTDKVDLICLSVTSYMCNEYLKKDNNAQKVADYVQTDGVFGFNNFNPFGGIDALALWSNMLPNVNARGRNVTNIHDNTLAHIEVATSAASFARMYEHFNGEAPATTDITEADTDTVQIAGKANIFPYNVGADATRLSIYEVDPATGFRVDGAAPIVEDLDIDSTGAWGPYEVGKGVTYEFVLTNELVSTDEQHFYREPFLADDYFIRLNVGRPGEGISSYLNRDAAHTNLVVARDREMWGDQGEGNDQVYINDDEVNILTPEAANQDRMLSSLFLSDQDGEKDSDYTLIEGVTQDVFIAGLDYYIPAATKADLSDLSTISVKLISRGSEDKVRVLNVPNWPADKVRTVSVQFRDFVQ